MDVEAIIDHQIIAQQLGRDDVQQALQSVDSLGNTDCLDTLGNCLIAIIADDNGLRLAGSDLSEGGLDLGAEEVKGHDDYNGYVFVDQGEGSVIHFTSEYT